VYAKDIQCNNQDITTFTLVTPTEEIPIQLPLLGRHNVANATAAGCIAYALSIRPKYIQTGIATVVPVDHRLNVYTGYQGARIINDSYNANPTAFKAAIAILADQPGKKILVSGDMKELGEHAEQYHEQLGIEAKKQGIEFLYTYGELSKFAAQAFGENAQHFLDQEELIATLKPLLNDQTTVLIKGSLSMNMRHVAEALKEN
jgi:UDP-N-acetylmuramoyl-tripeptide--D-alanyl-D-alanine ligase